VQGRKKTRADREEMEVISFPEAALVVGASGLF
jgi:hypothetical protein